MVQFSMQAKRQHTSNTSGFLIQFIILELGKQKGKSLQYCMGYCKQDQFRDHLLLVLIDFDWNSEEHLVLRKRKERMRTSSCTTKIKIQSK